MEITNGEIKVLSNQISNLSKKLDEYTRKQDTYHAESQRALSNQDIQIALLQQSNVAISIRVDDNKEEIKCLDDRLNKQDTINKIFGGLGGLLALLGAYIGINK